MVEKLVISAFFLVIGLLFRRSVNAEVSRSPENEKPPGGKSSSLIHVQTAQTRAMYRMLFVLATLLVLNVFYLFFFGR